MTLLRYLGGVLGLLVVVVVFNALTFTSPPPGVVTPPGVPDIAPQAVASRLAKALTFETISHMSGDNTDKDVFLAFHQYLQESFPLVHRTLSKEIVNELSLLYRWQGSDPELKPILLLAHQDVVPVMPESLSKWQQPPFAGRIVDGVIWGRGAVDIKSAILGKMEAIESLLENQIQPKRTIYLAFGHDEEIGGRQGAAHIARRLAEEQLEFEFVLDEGGTIVHQGVIPGIDSQVALVGVAEKGYVSLKLTARATGGHSSMPPRHTAVGVISRAITALEDNPFPANMEYSSTLFANIGPKMEGLNKWVFANMWLTQPLVEMILSGANTTNATIRTTTAATMISGSDKDNVLPDVASAVVNFRIMPGETIASVIAYVTKTIDDHRVEISRIDEGVNPSPVSPSNNHSFALLAQTIHQIANDPELVVSPYLVVGGTDAKHYSQLSHNIYRFAFNRFTPESLGQMHGINEQITVDDYLDMVTFYHQLILNLGTAPADSRQAALPQRRREQ